jgi:hypothetical protein
MRLLSIAARVAARRVAYTPDTVKDVSRNPITLVGPFTKSSEEEMAEIELPFGILGDFAPLLAEEMHVTPEEVNKGPTYDVPVGYSFEESYSPPQRQTRSDPGYPADYEIVVEITHLAGYKLSPEDQKTIKNTGLDYALANYVKETHEKSYADRHEPDWDAMAEARAEMRAERDDY